MFGGHQLKGLVGRHTDDTERRRCLVKEKLDGFKREQSPTYLYPENHSIFINVANTFEVFDFTGGRQWGLNLWQFAGQLSLLT